MNVDAETSSIGSIETDISDAQSSSDSSIYLQRSAWQRRFSYDSEQFAGLFAENSTESNASTISSDGDSLSSACSSVKAVSFTAFGRKLNEICNAHDIRSLQHLYLCRSSLEPTSIFVKELDYTDLDGVVWTFHECSVCSAKSRFVRISTCCHLAICQPCWQMFIQTTAATSLSVKLTGMYNLHCFGCHKMVPYSQALSSVEENQKSLILPPGHSACATARCPTCLTAPALRTIKQSMSSKDPLALVTKLRQKRGGRPIICEHCQSEFCSICGQLPHPRISCKQLQSDKALAEWASKPQHVDSDIQNARRCPSCNVLVSQDGGCPHMECACGKEFCYSCGRSWHRSENRWVPFLSCRSLWESQARRIAAHALVSVGFVTATLLTAPVSLPAIPIVLLNRRLRHSLLEKLDDLDILDADELESWDSYDSSLNNN